MQPKYDDGEMPFDLPIEESVTHYPQLNPVFNFNWHDLAQNRQGKFTRLQRQKMYRRISKKSSPNALVIAVVLWIIMMLVGNPTWSIIFLIPVIILGLLEMRHITKLTKAERQLGVQRVYGKVKKHPYPTQVLIGNQEFPVTPYQYLTLIEGETYTVYFTKPSHFILSIEYADAAKK